MKAKEYPWLKLWSSKWLYGSGRTMTAEKRGVWIDLLALANEVKFRDGTLRFEVDRPMTRDYIANILQIDRHLLDACLVAFQADINTDDGNPRVKVWEDDTIELTNWDKYQSKPETKIAKEIAIANAQETKRRNKIATDQLLSQINTLNKRLKALRYQIVDGEVVDTTNGEKMSFEELKKRQGLH